MCNFSKIEWKFYIRLIIWQWAGLQNLVVEELSILKVGSQLNMIGNFYSPTFCWEFYECGCYLPLPQCLLVSYGLINIERLSYSNHKTEIYNMLVEPSHSGWQPTDIVAIILPLIWPTWINLFKKKKLMQFFWEQNIFPFFCQMQVFLHYASCSYIWFCVYQCRPCFLLVMMGRGGCIDLRHIQLILFLIWLLE